MRKGRFRPEPKTKRLDPLAADKRLMMMMMIVAYLVTNSQTHVINDNLIFQHTQSTGCRVGRLVWGAMLSVRHTDKGN